MGYKFSKLNTHSGGNVIGSYSFTKIAPGAETATSGLKYTLSYDSTYYICSGIGVSTKTDIVIPEEYAGLPVRSIGANAFLNSNITSVIVPDSVTSISDRAFSACKSLKRITMSNNLISIGVDVFLECDMLTYNTFDNARYLPTKDSEYAILTHAVDNEITSCRISPDAYLICVNAFKSCTKLQSVFITNLTGWCNMEFEGFGSSPLYNDAKLYLNGELVTNLIIPDGVTSISDYAFYKCNSLKSVTIPNDVTSIGKDAFDCCSSLENVTIPNSVTSIGDQAFWGCKALTSITIPDSIKSIGKGAFQGCSNLWQMTLPFIGATKNGTSNAHFGYIFGATNYETQADYVPINLIDINISDNATRVPDYAYYGMHSAGNIPGSATYIGKSAYDSAFCTKDIIIPNFVTRISENAFRYFGGRNSITIGSGVTSIEKNAFYGWVTLRDVHYVGTETMWNEINIAEGNECLTEATFTFGTIEPEPEPDVPDEPENPEYSTGLRYTLRANDGNYEVSGIGTCTDTIIKIPDMYNGRLVTHISNSAFYDNANITGIVIPDGVMYIGDYTFCGCESLVNITIPKTVMFIGERAFDRNSTMSRNLYLTDVVDWCYAEIKSSPLVYGGNLYLNGELVTNLIIPDGVTEIGNNAFYHCTSLTSVTIPDSVTSIGNGAFTNCSKLTSVTIPNSVTEIGNFAFSACSRLTSVTIPDSVTSIGSYAFYYCSKLASVIIGNGVTSIGSYAFTNCSSLTDVYYKGTEEDMSKIAIKTGNDPLVNATIHYNYEEGD